MELDTAAKVTMRGICKRFDRVQALKDVDFEVLPGQIHALVGENGAGKSTLMRVLVGHMTADSGDVTIGVRTTAVAESHTGLRPKVGFVEQEGGLIAELTGAENLMLGARSGRLADRKKAGRTIAELAERFGGPIDVSLPVQSLAVGQRQRLEILIVMAHGAEVLVLDEPTAALGTEEAAALRQIVRQFAAEGGSVVYISHKLDEVLEIADVITVMRRGRVVGQHASDRITVEQLATEMVGDLTRAESPAEAEELLEVAMGVRVVHGEVAARETVCTLRGVLAVAPFAGETSLKGVDLDVHTGEIVGVAGVVGSGQTTLAEVLAGFAKPQSGIIRRDGVAGYVPEHRHRDAVAVDLSLVDNMLLHSHRRPEFARARWWFDHARVSTHVRDLLEQSHVIFGSEELPLSSLSGGNQQKAVVGREMEVDPRLVVAHNPYRGLDVRAISEVRDAMLNAAKSGAGVVFISPDLDELRQIAHRIVVLFDGRIVGEVAPDEHDSERLGRMLGGAA